MAPSIYWYSCLLTLLCAQEILSDNCLPDETCSQCYSALVEQITKNDSNMFQVQKKFFPPDKAPPVIVIVTYNYIDEYGDIVNSTLWYWSTSTFYLYHPIHVFQFTSLLFSDISKLWIWTWIATTEHMQLLTQRVSGGIKLMVATIYLSQWPNFKWYVEL